MRTTIRIDDELYRSVKARAATSGRTIAAVLDDAIRLGLNPPHLRAPVATFTIRATGSDGLLPGIDLTSNASVREVLDEGLPLDEMR